MASKSDNKPSTGLDVMSRTIAGVFLSYALANFAAMAVALACIDQGRDAENLGVMIGFLVYAASAIRAYWVQSHLRAWIEIGGATAFAFLAFLLLGGAA